MQSSGLVEGVPDPDALAYRLVARESPLHRAILHELIGRPKRYAELQPLLGGKGDHNLTVSLKRLQEWGLIERRTDARQEPVVHTYELTPLGIQVMLTIPAIQPIQESLDRFERARAQVALADLREMLATVAAPTRGADAVDVTAFDAQSIASNLDIAARLDPLAVIALHSYMLSALVPGTASREFQRTEPKLEEFAKRKKRRSDAFR